MTLVFKWRHITSSKGWKLLIFCELAWGGESIQLCLCSVLISHAQKSLTAHDNRMQGPGPRSKDSLKLDELTSIPLVNVWLWLRGNGEKHVTINVKGLYIHCSVLLKVLQFDEVHPCPLINYRRCRPDFVCKGNVAFIVNYKRCTCTTSPCRYLLKLFKRVVFPLVDDWVGRIVEIRYGKKGLFRCGKKKIKADSAFRCNVLKSKKKCSISKINNWV